MNDLTGKLFSYLRVLEYSHKHKGRLYWNCKCVCGKEFKVRGSALTSQNTKSCGCKKGEFIRKARGKPWSIRAYNTWNHMMQRCYNSKDKSYFNYGGRGISVCERWHEFENFYADMGEPPENRSLDRLNTNKNYTPSNCKWSTRSEQAINRRKVDKYSNKYKNICWMAHMCKYHVYFTRNKKRYNLGYFKTEEEALEIRNDFLITNNEPIYDMEQINV